MIKKLVYFQFCFSFFLGRHEFRYFKGHFDFFFETINNNTNGVYSNIEKTMDAVKEVLRRNHELENKKIRDENKIRKSNET